MERPILDQFDLSEVSRPSDGVLYLYRSDNDGFWYVDRCEDLALEGATGYPVGELRDQEGDEWDANEHGELIALYVGEPPCEHPLRSIERRGEPDWKNSSQTIWYYGFCTNCGADVEVQYRFDGTVERDTASTDTDRYGGDSDGK